MKLPEVYKVSSPPPELRKYICEAFQEVSLFTISDTCPSSPGAR